MILIFVIVVKITCGDVREEIKTKENFIKSFSTFFEVAYNSIDYGGWFENSNGDTSNLFLLGSISIRYSYYVSRLLINNWNFGKLIFTLEYTNMS